MQLGWAHAASENPQGSKQIQIDGQAFGGVNYTLDGTDNQDAILGIIVINPNYESMSEAKIATQNFDAEFGKAVASVQTVQTKSGTNEFHGTLFDNRESNANLARDPFTVTKAAGYPGGLKNQFGGSIGGPILKDKAFFFGDYQGVRQKVRVFRTRYRPIVAGIAELHRRDQRVERNRQAATSANTWPFQATSCMTTRPERPYRTLTTSFP